MSTPAYARAPLAINKYLLPLEVQVATVRQHPAVLIIPATQACGGLAVGITLTWALPHTLPQLLAIWAAVSILVLYCVRMTARWSVDYLVVTTERILLVSGFTHRSAVMIPLNQLTNMSLARTWSGRMLGYGAFLNESGRPRVISAFVPYPEQLYLLIMGMLFPSSAGDAEDDDRRHDLSGDAT
jgi:hypothetical protein